MPFETSIVTVEPSSASAPRRRVLRRDRAGLPLREDLGRARPGSRRATSRSRASASARPTAFGTATCPARPRRGSDRRGPRRPPCRRSGLREDRASGASLGAVTMSTSKPSLELARDRLVEPQPLDPGTGLRVLLREKTSQTTRRRAGGAAHARRSRRSPGPAALLVDRCRGRCPVGLRRCRLVSWTTPPRPRGRPRTGGAYGSGDPARARRAPPAIVRLGADRVRRRVGHRGDATSWARHGPNAVADPTNPIRSYIASSVGADASRAAVGAEASRRRSSPSSARSSR